MCEREWEEGEGERERLSSRVRLDTPVTILGTWLSL